LSLGLLFVVEKRLDQNFMLQ